MTIKEETDLAVQALKAAHKSLETARRHCDSIYEEGGVHYNDVTETMQDVAEMIRTLRRPAPCAHESRP